MFLRTSKGLEELSINDLHMLPIATSFLNNMSEMTQLKTLRVKFRCCKDYKDIIDMKGLMNKLALKVVPSDASDALVNIMQSHKKLESLELDANRIARSIIVNNIPNGEKKYVKGTLSYYGCITKLKFIKMKGMTNVAYVTYKQDYEALYALSRANAYYYGITAKPPDDINYTKFFRALKFLEDSLKELTLHYIDFSKISLKDIENISKCQNLVRISFNHCQGITIKHCTSLSKNKLHIKKLEITGLGSATGLSLDQTYISIPLISIWGSTLEILHLNILSKETENALIIHCSNLKELIISESNAYSLTYIYSFLQQSSLKSLHINKYRGNYNEFCNLVPKLPTTLIFLGLNTDFDSYNELEFENLVKYCGKFFDLKTLNIKCL
ncbi:4684_t:CDS:2 [Gigaspora rosea]|nr:4684_t:CDS:2 [Gigaspora rosea]